MAEPTNDILLLATEPHGVEGFPNKLAPEPPATTLGYNEQSFAFEEYNYTIHNHGEWLKYHEDEYIPLMQSQITALVQSVSALQAQVIHERIAVGEIIEITGDATNPAILKGYGVWSSFGEGVALVGVGGHTDDRSVLKTWTDGQEEGEYQHVQTEDEMFDHTHIANEVPDHQHNKTLSLRGNATGDTGKHYKAGTSDTYGITTGKVDLGGGHTPVLQKTGGTSPMNNTQPSLAVYRWRRTS